MFAVNMVNNEPFGMVLNCTLVTVIRVVAKCCVQRLYADASGLPPSIALSRWQTDQKEALWSRLK